uniref:Uncharacterized protein n=1 Tax=Chromera velia CCMP2878 TaxID=1169474 RepID=A0A0G4IEA0_9ALVE|eukprot:Cvel_13677.t1-p1 / transcript=Cvel_13677.t1 / gene=Cvel_13677 / organism=Chromera_velia_CCMP2878 / gene_product=Keratin-associated protein 10-8, putative / transcript_product=Keratin-associated protein 10-8, putative / location=Cvel_scaffold944:43217-44918(+) / protein_length=187 / sequence_SO=supercontig / SO=protein_coding / is_pseudo=false
MPEIAYPFFQAFLTVQVHLPGIDHRLPLVASRRDEVVFAEDHVLVWSEPFALFTSSLNLVAFLRPRVFASSLNLIAFLRPRLFASSLNLVAFLRPRLFASSLNLVAFLRPRLFASSLNLVAFLRPRLFASSLNLVAFLRPRLHGCLLLSRGAVSCHSTPLSMSSQPSEARGGAKSKPPSDSPSEDDE